MVADAVATTVYTSKRLVAAEPSQHDILRLLDMMHGELRQWEDEVLSALQLELTDELFVRRQRRGTSIHAVNSLIPPRRMWCTTTRAWPSRTAPSP
jgi:hypothetical protein